MTCADSSAFRAPAARLRLVSDDDRDDVPPPSPTQGRNSRPPEALLLEAFEQLGHMLRSATGYATQLASDTLWEADSGADPATAARLLAIHSRLGALTRALGQSAGAVALLSDSSRVLLSAVR